jgi:hypothetical protein
MLVARMKRGSVGLVVLCVLLLASNVFLLLKAQSLERSYQSLKKFSLEVKSGTRVPPIEGFDLQGGWRQVTYGQDGALVVFAFSPACAFSDRNWAMWERLLPSGRGGQRAVFIDVSKTVGSAYLASHATGNAVVVAKPDARTVVSYNLSMTPQTIVVDVTGTIRGVWSGVLNEGDVAEIGERLRRLRD